MLPPVYILIEDNPNCTSLDGLFFQPKAPPRQVKRVRVARDGQPVSCDVVTVNEGWPRNLRWVSDRRFRRWRTLC